jgi:hypothetical protein
MSCNQFPAFLSVDVLLAALFPPLDCLLVRISLFSLDFVFGFQELSFLFGRITIELAAQPEQAAEAVLRLIAADGSSSDAFRDDEVLFRAGIRKDLRVLLLGL